MRVAVPAEVCWRVSTRAQQLAQETIRGMGWSNKSVSAVLPHALGDGWVALRVAQDAHYLMYQDRGTDSFIMMWVEGRTVPLSCKFGDGPHIRRGKNPGQPGWVNIPHVGQVWRDQKWKHPGLKPRRFLESGISKAVEENRPQYGKILMGVLKGDATY